MVQTATPPTTTPDLKTLIADLSSALKSDAKIHMKALEVEVPEEAKNVGTANPSFEDGKGSLERPNGEDATILLNDGPNGQLSQQIASEKEKGPQVAQTPVCTLTTLGLGQKRPAGVLFEPSDTQIREPPSHLADGGQQGPNQAQEGVPNQAQEPASRKAVPVGSGNDPIEGETGLVDSGATHALREGAQEEMRAAKHVPVTLAGDEKSTLCQSQLGTVLVLHPTQPLVPMGALVEVLGCSVKWTPKVLKITHPKHGNLKVSLRNRCPEIAAIDALNLIQELEAKQLEQFNSQVREMELRLEAMQAEEEKYWIEHIHDVRKDGSAVSMWKALMKCPFTKDLPSDVLELMIEGFDPNKGWMYLKDLPLTRKQRKRLMNSHDWIVHLYAGERITRPTLSKPLKMVKCFWRLTLRGQKLGIFTNGPPCTGF